MLKVYKVLHKIYDTNISAAILELAQDGKTKGHSLVFQSELSNRGIRYLYICCGITKVQTFESRLDSI